MSALLPSATLFEQHQIRRLYDDATETWWFSVVDVIQALVQQPDQRTARKYWNKLKQRLGAEGSQLVTTCHQLKADIREYPQIADSYPQTTAATPSGSNTSLVGQMLIAVTPSGSSAFRVFEGLTPEGSQQFERKRPHATTTLKGSQPTFRVSDRSGTPQVPILIGTEEYSGERDPRLLRGARPNNNSDKHVQLPEVARSSDRLIF